MPDNVNTELTEDAVNQIQNVVSNFSWQKAGVLALLLVCSVVAIKIVLKLMDRAMERAKLDRGVRTFLHSGMNVLLWLVAICVLLGYLGVPMTSLVAVVSVLGLAVSLAVQGLLSNLAGGIMILSARPFSAGDWVEAAGVSGTVSEVGLVYTKLNTVDNKVVYVPNGDISSKTIINYTAEEKRQVELRLNVSYDAPAEKVKEVIGRVVGEHPMTMPTPAPLIRVFAYRDSAVEYLVRCWCATEDYWSVYFDLTEQIKAAFDQAGIEITYNHLNVHILEK